MSAFRFSSYSVNELRACGDAFTKDINEHADIFAAMTSSYHWTDYVLDWFTEARSKLAWAHAKAPYSDPWRSLFGSREIATRLRGERTNAEFILDLTHAGIHPLEPAVREKGTGELKAESLVHRVMLGLESEWGHELKTMEGTRKVLRDAAKLAAVRADSKVMLFASRGAEHRAEIVLRLHDLREGSGDPAPWLWIDVPWFPERRGARWEPVFDLLTAAPPPPP